MNSITGNVSEVVHPLDTPPFIAALAEQDHRLATIRKMKAIPIYIAKHSNYDGEYEVHFYTNQNTAKIKAAADFGTLEHAIAVVDDYRNAYFVQCNDYIRLGSPIRLEREGEELRLYQEGQLKMQNDQRRIFLEKQIKACQDEISRLKH